MKDDTIVQSEMRLAQVPSSLSEAIGRFGDVVAESFRGSDFSLAVFGKALTAEYDPTRHAARTVVVAEQLEPAALRRLAAHGMRMGRAGLDVPLLMTPKHIESSLDSFPLELLEIQQLHVTVRGRDHFENLSFDLASVRLQCERELKRTLFAMRHGLIAGAGREGTLGPVLNDAARNLFRTLRGALWLRGEKAFRSESEVVSDLEKMLGRKFPGMRSAAMNHGFEDSDFDGLYADVEALGDLIDGW